MVALFGMGAGTLALSGLAYGYSSILYLAPPFFETLLLFTWLLAAGLILYWVATKFDPLR